VAWRAQRACGGLATLLRAKRGSLGGFWPAARRQGCCVRLFAAGSKEGEDVRKREEENLFVEVYRNEKGGLIRLLSVFSFSQAVYWLVLSSDAYFSSTVLKLPEKVEQAEGFNAEMLSLYSSPSWMLFGLATSALCIGMTKMYSSCFVSRIEVNENANKAKIQAHTMWANPSPPLIFSISDISVVRAGPKDKYIPLGVKGRRMNFLVDDGGDWFPLPYQSSSEGAEGIQVDENSPKMQVLKIFGGETSRFRDTDVEKAFQNTDGERFPTPEELRQARIVEAKKYKKNKSAS